jgi:hypothetical protein
VSHSDKGEAVPLTADEWALIRVYRACCRGHRENIRFFAYETLALCHADIPPNVIILPRKFG